MSQVADAEIRVRVHAGARRDELRPIGSGAIAVRVVAPAVDGRANKALCRLLAKQLGIAPSKVTILHGARSRDKLIRVEGMDQATVDAWLEM